VIAVAWLIVAIGGAALTARADEQLRAAMASERANFLRGERRRAIIDSIESVLVPGVGGLPLEYQLSVYGPTTDNRYVFPLYPRALTSTDPAIFEVGAGAAGMLWQRRDDYELGVAVLVVRGSAVSDHTHHLTPEQQQRFKLYEVVACALIPWKGRPVGMLTVLGRKDVGFFDEDGARQLQTIADSLGWLMPQALQWMLPMDGEEGQSMVMDVLEEASDGTPIVVVFRPSPEELAQVKEQQLEREQRSADIAKSLRLDHY
jgi:hypothetical protein